MSSVFMEQDCAKLSILHRTALLRDIAGSVRLLMGLYSHVCCRECFLLGLWMSMFVLIGLFTATLTDLVSSNSDAERHVPARWRLPWWFAMRQSTGTCSLKHMWHPWGAQMPSFRIVGDWTTRICWYSGPKQSVPKSPSGCGFRKEEGSAPRFPNSSLIPTHNWSPTGTNTQPGPRAPESAWIENNDIIFSVTSPQPPKIKLNK